LYTTTDLAKPPFTELAKLSEAVRNSLQGGVNMNLLERVQALRNRVAGLTPMELTALNLDQDFKNDVLMKLDESLMAIPAIIMDAGIRMGGAPQPNPPKMDVPPGGRMMPGGASFDVSVTPPMTPGTIELFSPADYDSTLADPPADYRFVGNVFDLLGGDGLDLTGATITVRMEFERGLSLGATIDDSLPVHLVRLANGKMEFLSAVTNPSETVVMGMYSPVSLSLEGEQLGEFALVQLVPEPAAAALAVALAWTICLARQAKFVEEKRRKRVRTI
jgi:hypothetical protein